MPEILAKLFACYGCAVLLKSCLAFLVVLTISTPGAPLEDSGSLVLAPRIDSVTIIILVYNVYTFAHSESYSAVPESQAPSLTNLARSPEYGI